MAGGIKANDLIDIEGAEKAIERLEKRFEGLGKSMVTVMTHTEKSFDGLIAKAQQLQELYASIGKGGRPRGGSSATSASSSEVDKLIKEIERYREAIKGMNDLSSINSKSIAELKVGVAALKKEFENLDPASDNFVADQKRIADNIKLANSAIAMQSAALKETKRAVTDAIGSYNKLSRETKELKDQLRAMPNAFNLTTGAINRNNAQAVIWQKTIERNEVALRKMDASMGNYHRNVGNYSSALSGMGTSISSLIAPIIGVASAYEALHQSIRIIDQMSRLKLGLESVSSSSTQVTQRWQFLQKQADETGQDIEKLTESYISFAGATRNTVLEGEAGDKIFKSFSDTFSALGKNSEVANRGLYAIQQMISKTRVNSEELNQQLAEALPGANKLFADALGVSTAQLADMMKKGQVLAADVLPKVAEQLEKLYGARAQKNIETISGSWNRVTTQFKLFLDQLNSDNAISGFFAKMNNGLADTIRSLKTLTTDLPAVQKRVETIRGSRGAFEANWKAGIIGTTQDYINAAGQIAGENNDIQSKVDQQRSLKGPKERVDFILKEEDALRKLRKEYNAHLETGKSIIFFSSERKRQTAEYIAQIEKQERLLQVLKTTEQSAYTAPGKTTPTTTTDASTGGGGGGKASSERMLTQFEKLTREAEKLRSVVIDQLLADFNAGRELAPSDDVLAKWNKLYAQISAVSTAAGDTVPSNLRELNDKLNKNPVNIADQIQYQNVSAESTPTSSTESPIDLTKYNQLLQVHEAEMALIQSKIIDGSLSRFSDAFIPELQGQLKKVQELELQAAVEQNDQKKQAINEELQLEKQKYSEIMAMARRDAQLRRELQEQQFALAQESASAVLQIYTDQLSARQAANQAQMEHELSLVEGNQEAQERIRKEYAKKDLELRQKQARAEKAAAVFSIALNTVKAIAAANAIGPPQSIAFMAIAAAIGAVQLAAALAKPIPQFYKGTKNAPEGPAWVGERGAELLESKGTFRLVEKPSIVPLHRGDKVYTAEETRRMLAKQDDFQSIVGRNEASARDRDQIYASQAMLRGFTGGSQVDYNKMTDSFVKALDSRPVHQTFVDEQGLRKRHVKKNSIITYHNARYSLGS